MKIQILGSGCPRCKALGETVEAAAKAMGLSYDFEKVTDMAEIARLGVMATPAIVVDGAVISAGRLPSTEEVKEMLAAKSKA